jgi:alkyldihydroxyacetonephosphate synthase
MRRWNGWGEETIETRLPREAVDFLLQRWRALKTAVSEAIVRGGGAISYQHGVGKHHSRYLTAEKGERGVRALRAMVEDFDPESARDSGNLFPERPR